MISFLARCDAQNEVHALGMKTSPVSPGNRQITRFGNLVENVWLLLIVSAILRVTTVSVLLVHSPPSWGVNEAAGIARQLIAGRGFASPFHDSAGPTAWLAPVYPLMITGVLRIFGEGSTSVWVAVLLNVIFGSLTTLIVLQLGRDFFGRSAGTLAAWMWAISPPMVVMPWLPWETCLSALVFSFALLRTLRLGPCSPLREWAVCGGVWAFAALLNPALLAPLPALAALAARKPRCRSGAGAMLLVFLLAMAPWTLRNFRVFRQFVPVRSNLWPEVYFGNVSFELHPIGGSMLYQREGEIAFARDLRNRVIEHLRSHPGEFALRSGERFLNFWTLPPFFRSYSIVISVAALAGAFLARLRGREWLSFASVLGLYPLLYYITYAFSRYRHPIEPTMYVLAASAFSELVFYFRREVSGLSE